MGKMALIAALTSMALPAAAYAGNGQRQESEKACPTKERAAAPTDIRQQARKPVSPAEKRYILM